jgi:hypothetical protein
MNTTFDVVMQAILLALDLSWFSEYTRWASAWLDGSDRSQESADLAVARVRQWSTLGDSWATRCCWNAAAAAAELATGYPNRAESSAQAAVRAAQRANGLATRQARRPQDELIVGEEEFSAGRIVRGPGFRPRTEERLQ